MQAEPEQKRPDQVKLLLDRQGPQVIEHWRRSELRKIGGVAEDVPPVAHVDGGSDYVLPEGRQLGSVQQRDPHHYHCQHQEKGRQEPPGSPKPEVAEPKVADGVSLSEKQVGYQVTTQGKEHTYAEQTPLGPAQLQVVGDDGKHRKGPQPVEPRHVALGTSDRLRHDNSPRNRWCTAPCHAPRSAAQTTGFPSLSATGAVRPCRTARQCLPRLAPASRSRRRCESPRPAEAPHKWCLTVGACPFVVGKESKLIHKTQEGNNHRLPTQAKQVVRSVEVNSIGWCS